MMVVDPGSAPVRAAFTTRHPGRSVGAFASGNLGSACGDDPDAVRANRVALSSRLGFDPDRAVTLDQVHGSAVVTIGRVGGDGAFTGAMTGFGDADAAVTGAPGVALLAMGADCPVVLAWDAGGLAVAAVHAGWRGLIGGVLEAAVVAMGSPVTSMRAVIGPHVRPCCYPVGQEVRAGIATRFGPDVVRGASVDLGACCEGALLAAGLSPGAIARVPGCTACDQDRFFSYRRDGGETGRQAGVVWLPARG